MEIIIVATELEILPILKNFSYKKVFENPFVVYENSSKKIVISGIGKTKAKACTHWILNRFKVKSLVNVGACGTLKEGMNRGDIFCISEVLLNGSSSRIIFSDKHRGGKILLTSDIAIKRKSDRLEKSKLADVVDMELYGIAEAILGTNNDINILSSYKMVSDTTEECNIIENIKNLRDKLLTMENISWE